MFVVSCQAEVKLVRKMHFWHKATFDVPFCFLLCQNNARQWSIKSEKKLWVTSRLWAADPWNWQFSTQIKSDVHQREIVSCRGQLLKYFTFLSAFHANSSSGGGSLVPAKHPQWGFLSLSKRQRYSNAFLLSTRTWDNSREDMLLAICVGNDIEACKE